MNLSIVAPISESSMSGRFSVMHSSNSTRTAERFWRLLALTRFSAKFLHIRRAYARGDSGFCGGIVFQSAMQVSLKHSSASCRLPVISFAAQMQRRLFSYECHTTKDGVPIRMTLSFVLHISFIQQLLSHTSAAFISCLFMYMAWSALANTSVYTRSISGSNTETPRAIETGTVSSFTVM